MSYFSRAQARRCGRRRRLVGAMVALLALALVRSGAAQSLDPKFWRIAAGPADSSSFALATAIAGGLSAPPGSRPCERGGSCGVAGLIANVEGAESNRGALEALLAERVDAAVLRADRLATLMQSLPVGRGLRQLAVLQTDAVQILAPAGVQPSLVTLAERPLVWIDPDPVAEPLVDRALAGIWRLDLGRETGPLLRAAGNLREAAELIDAGTAVGVLRLAPLIVPELEPGRTLQPVVLSDGQVEQILATSPVFIRTALDLAPTGGKGEMISAGIPTLLLVRAGLDHELAAAVTRALWHPGTQKQIAASAPEGRGLNRTLGAIVTLVPLHPGAAAVYEQNGR